MSGDTIRLELPKWYDLHAHFRQDDLIAPLIKEHLAMGCAGILAMPNTKPPVAKVLEAEPLPYWSIEDYLTILLENGADAFDDVIVPLYLTKDTTPGMIEAGAKSGLLRAAKYYPPHGTTGADFGHPFTSFIENGVFKALEEAGVVLCIHGEEHHMPAETYFGRDTNAEEYFYTERLPRALEAFPALKIACEHVTTKVAVDLVKQAGDNVAASITPQHLLYTIGDLLQGLKYHLYSLPLLKFEEDRAALRQAIVTPSNTKFYAGTDSAPHTTKATDCGCAAGCYTGGIAPQLYAQGFELAGVDLSTDGGIESFKRFLCLNGAGFYGLDVSVETFALEKKPQSVEALKIGSETVLPLPLGLRAASEHAAFMTWCVTSA